jgi:hypothetical protein
VLLVPAVLAQSAAVTLIMAPTMLVESSSRNTSRLAQRTSAEIQRQIEEAKGDPKKLEQLSKQQKQQLEELSKSWAATGSMAVGGMAAILLGLLAFIITIAVTYGLAVPLTTGALTIIVADRVTGGSVTPGQAWKIMLTRLPRLLGATVPAFFLVLGGLLLCLLPGLALSFLFVFVTPVVLLENVGGTSALKRSAALVKANMPQVFIMGIVFSVIRMVASFVAHLFVPSSALFFDNLVSGVLMMLLLPLPIVGTVLLYLDIRRQADGLTEQGLRAGVDGLRRA